MNKKIKQYWKRNYKILLFQTAIFILCALLSSRVFLETFQGTTPKNIIDCMVTTLMIMAFVFNAFLFFTCGFKNQKILELLKIYSSSVCVIIVIFFYLIEKYGDNYKMDKPVDENFLLPYKFFWILTIFMIFYLIKITLAVFFDGKNDNNSA
ncbi:hypothetical protein [Campylobacter helveticus]|uniref:hypothetical protein n=1 Tax=Campylobacter helveticus TaxID=28898 RepID=UPI0012790A24|nr:hypothetical protein [Campylobacter helveticus]EAK0465289.1 hypothetical protein [Campylobacter upsaliensis]EAK1046999.1 hypothetical protein [Campylobacter upsaliensis]EAK9971314.1 hypothetical protein [Campylobacter upsaliensis]EAL3914645.1 hypothetical protein [Campylobacter upsaliensis]EFO9376517.1 hypothetical protein [Campylobacter upsaliensis]